MTEVLKSLSSPKLSTLRGQVFTINYCNDYNSLSLHVDFSWCLFQLPTKNEDHEDEKTVIITNKSPLGNGVKISASQKSIKLDAHHDTVKKGLCGAGSTVPREGFDSSVIMPFSWCVVAVTLPI